MVCRCRTCGQGLDEASSISKKLRRKQLDPPRVATITTPSVHGVEGVTARVLLIKHKGPLWLELSEETLSYLIQVAAAQARALCIDSYIDGQTIVGHIGSLRFLGWRLPQRWQH